MRRHLRDILACPECQGELALEVKENVGEYVLTGTLSCTACERKYAVRNGIPRFASQEEMYCKSFGWQWDRFRRTQVDDFSGTCESKRRFLAETGWRPEELKGLLVLDAGCGAGRFTTVACQLGAKVVAVDLSGGAAEACARNLEELGLRAEIIQASLYRLPFRPNAFDRIFSMGVLQHTPDPERAMRTLPLFLKPRGGLAYWIYEKRWYRFLLLRNHLRLVTRRLPISVTWRLTRLMVLVFFPITLALSLIPGLRVILPLLPIASRHYWGKLSLSQQWEWTLLDTFDSYSAAYEFPQRDKDVVAALTEAGMEQVHRIPARGMAIVAKRPECQ